MRHDQLALCWICGSVGRLFASPLLCMKLDTCVGAAADRDASPACLSHLPSSLSLSLSHTHARAHTHTHTCTNVAEADNSRVVSVTVEVCSLSPDPTTNQVDNYANRLYFSHVASFSSRGVMGCVCSCLRTGLCHSEEQLNSAFFFFFFSWKCVYSLWHVS